MKRTLAVDLGSHLGLAWRALDGSICSRQVLLPQGAGQHGLRCWTFAFEVGRCLDDLNPGAFVPRVAYELPSSVRGYWASRVLFGLEAVLLAECERCSVAYRSIEVRQVKRALTGSPSADKDAMQKAAGALAGRWVATEDEADAIGVLVASETLPAKGWD